jgi:hypothetical protein
MLLQHPSSAAASCCSTMRPTQLQRHIAGFKQRKVCLKSSMAMDDAVPSEQPGKEVGTGWQLGKPLCQPEPTAVIAWSSVCCIHTQQQQLICLVNREGS